MKMVIVMLLLLQSGQNFGFSIKRKSHIIYLAHLNTGLHLDVGGFILMLLQQLHQVFRTVLRLVFPLRILCH